MPPYHEYSVTPSYLRDVHLINIQILYVPVPRNCWFINEIRILGSTTKVLFKAKSIFQT